MRTNLYAGKCGSCGGRVPAETGQLIKDGGSWTVLHWPDECLTIDQRQEQEAQAVTRQAENERIRQLQPGMYLGTDGEFYKVQLSKAGRPYAKVARVIDHGDDLPNEERFTVHFEYAQGAVYDLTEETRLSWQEARDFGMQFNTCIWCGLTLADAPSVLAGYGPVCGAKNGWPVLTKMQARKVIDGEWTYEEAVAYRQAQTDVVTIRTTVSEPAQAELFA